MNIDGIFLPESLTPDPRMATHLPRVLEAADNPDRAADLMTWLVGTIPPREAANLVRQWRVSGAASPDFARELGRMIMSRVGLP